MCWPVYNIQWKVFLVCPHHHKCVQGDWMLCEVSLIHLNMKNIDSIRYWLRNVTVVNPNKKEIIYLFDHTTPHL